MTALTTALNIHWNNSHNFYEFHPIGFALYIGINYSIFILTAKIETSQKFPLCGISYRGFFKREIFLINRVPFVKILPLLFNRCSYNPCENFPLKKTATWYEYSDDKLRAFYWCLNISLTLKAVEVKMFSFLSCSTKSFCCCNFNTHCSSVCCNFCRHFVSLASMSPSNLSWRLVRCSCSVVNSSCSDNMADKLSL